MNGRAPARGDAALVASLLHGGVARAQATYGSAPIGGRSALMGGTGIALGHDGAAPLLNPATIVHIDDSGLAFSVNFYSYQTAHLTDFHQPLAIGGGPERHAEPAQRVARHVAHRLAAVDVLLLLHRRQLGEQRPPKDDGSTRTARATARSRRAW